MFAKLKPHLMVAAVVVAVLAIIKYALPESIKSKIV